MGEKRDRKRLNHRQSLNVVHQLCVAAAIPVPLMLIFAIFLCCSDVMGVIWIFFLTCLLHIILYTPSACAVCALTNYEPEPICCSILKQLNLTFIVQTSWLRCHVTFNTLIHTWGICCHCACETSPGLWFMSLFILFLYWYIICLWFLLPFNSCFNSVTIINNLIMVTRRGELCRCTDFYCSMPSSGTPSHGIRTIISYYAVHMFIFVV